MTAPELDTDVVVIGTGPCGAAAALALATYGVRVHVATKWNWLANSPRAHITNQRTMEVLRDLDVEAEATGYATDWNLMGETLFTTSLAGEEVARLRTWGTGDSRIGDYLTGSPCPMLDIPQPYMEPVLVKNAGERGASFAFNTEYLDHQQDADGVTVTLRDRLTDREYTVRAKYLVGADGARSKVFTDAGLSIEGAMGRAGTVYTLFHADLTRFVAHRPSILHWIMTPGAGYGEIGMGTLRAIRPWHTWIAGWGYDINGPAPDLRPEAVLPRIKEMIGDDTVEVDIETVTTWQINQAWAPVYSSGRVFCGGDAVHRHPPSSGLGSNTSIQDAFNLAWKLAFVVKGWAASELLDTYTAERAPVGEQIVARANQSRVDYGPINDCFRTTGQADPVAAGLAKLRDPSPEGARVRRELHAALELKNTEFNAQGTELNQRYTSTAVIVDPDNASEIWKRDQNLYLQATTRPGAKLPHAWLVDAAGQRISTLDVVGKGKFSLLTGLSGTAWANATAKLDLPMLRTVVIGAADTRDPYTEWSSRSEIDETGAILVRPDGYVAWRHTAPVWDDGEAFEQLRTALSGLLGVTG